MADLILGKQERLAKMREQKRKRDAEKKAKQDALTGGMGGSIFGADGRANISNAFIDQILRDEDPFAPKEEQKSFIQGEDGAAQKESLKVSGYVVDMEIPSPEKTITYHREVQCSIIDQSQVKYLQTIKEEEEHDHEGQGNYNEMVALGMNPASPEKRRATLHSSSFAASGRNSAVKGSFIGGNFNEGAATAPETEEQKAEREKKEFQESFEIMGKDDAKDEMKKKGFEDFLNKTSRIIERALDQDFDVVGDFFKDDDEENDAGLAHKKRDKITQAFMFQPNVHTKRAVTSMDWSPKVGELLLVSYSKCSEYRYDEPDGLVNIFSTNLKTRPEVTLICQNEVTKAIFNPYQPNIVIGATQSGYIVQWDIRAKNTPVQKSTLAKDGHHNSIFSLAVIGTQNAHNIVSISSDSKMCLWHFGELSNPKIHFNLFNQQNNNQQNDQKLIYVNTMEFPEDETDKFYVGAEDHNIYQANLHTNTNPGSAQQQQTWRTFSSHCAPVTKIAMHPGKSMNEDKASSGGLADMSELMLSASMDWTVKLWYPKNEFTSVPIYTFESSQEYVYDVQWSPVHPSVFASVDGDGFVDVWDINRDTESPLVHKKAFESQGGSGQAYKDFDDGKALGSLRWSRDGRRLALGDSEGFVSIWQVDKDLYMPKQSDFDQIEQLIANNSNEEGSRNRGDRDDKDYD